MKKRLCTLTILLVLFLVVVCCFVQITSSAVSNEDNQINIKQPSNEIIEKRTYESQTFANPDGTFTTQIGAGNMFFYDGEQYSEISKISEPEIKKEIIILNETPKNNVIQFGDYKLHKGINVSIENEEIIVRDGNNKTIKILPKPYATDSNGDVIYGEYVVSNKNDDSNTFSLIYNEFFNFNNNVNDENNINSQVFDDNGNDNDYSATINIGVKLDKNWLKTASYPVEVDPNAILNATTGVYDGHIEKTILNVHSRWDNGVSFDVGAETSAAIDYYWRAFLEFDATAIPNNAEVTYVNLTLTITQAYGAGDKVNIFSMQGGGKPSNTTLYPDTNEGNQALFDRIGASYFGGNYVPASTSFQSTGTKTFNLNTNVALQNASAHLETVINGGDEKFAVGFFGSDETNDDYVIISSSESGSTGPMLNVTYTLGGCTYSGSGNWEINSLCTINNQNITVAGDISIPNGGTLNMTGTTNVTFSGAGRKIYIYSGGQIYITNTSAFNKINTFIK
ncbi:MAG: hypothetical protein WC533_03260 [Candidatus Pacearchaeota archaeon]